MSRSIQLELCLATQPERSRFDASNGGMVRVGLGTEPGGDPALFDAIPLRQSTRSDDDGSKLSAADLHLLEAAAAMPGVDLILITGRACQRFVLKATALGLKTAHINQPVEAVMA